MIETVAKALLINDSNQALVLTVGEYKARPDKAYKPDLPGGMVDSGETGRDAVIREIAEETGINVTVEDVQLAYAATGFYEKDQKSYNKLFYLVYVDTTPEVKISWEHDSFEWVPLEGITKSVEFSPFSKMAIEYCSEHGLINWRQ